MNPRKKKSIQLELWPDTKWEWRESYQMTPKELNVFWSYTQVIDHHLIWRGHCNNKGLPMYYHRSLKKNLSARRIAWTIFHGPIANKYDVKSICGNPLCISSRCVRRVTKGHGLEEAPIYYTNYGA